MTLRSPLTPLFGLLSSLCLAAAGSFVVSAAGCSDDAITHCDNDGRNCMVCDGLGCRPANPDVTGTGGAGGGGTGGAKSTGGGGAGTGGSGAGGAAPCDPKQATCACDADNTCSDGKTCVNGLCIDGCNFSYECGPGKICFDGACVAGCDATKPCDAGYVCTNGGCVPDTANPQCDATQPCPSGQICADGLCTTGCNVNADCKSGEICDGSAHACIDDPSPKPLCDSATPCPAPQICQSDGYCHYPCAGLTECKLIDNRFVACDSGVCKTQEEVAPECTLTKPCPAGENCISNKCL